MISLRHEEKHALKMEQLSKAIEIRLLKAGHSKPKEGADELIAFMNIIVHKELENETSSILGPLKFAEHFKGIVRSERTKYGFAIIPKSRRKACFELEISLNTFGKLIDACIKTGVLKLAEENNCYVDT